MADWFTVNVADARWRTHDTFGAWCPFESPEAPFPDFGINLHVLQPGQPNALFHSEAAQEDFLVLAGECVLLVDSEEQSLRAWDFIHCSAGTEHVFVGAGDGPCVILMVGARPTEEKLFYPVSELARRYGASVDGETADPDEAYARFAPPPVDRRPDVWEQLPWA